jgi:AcrR family transcriptional regulator
MNKNSKSNGKPAISQTVLRKERERLEHRRAILKNAEAVFAKHGFHGATIEEIAREAGFAVGTIYNIFKNKDDLYLHVVLSHHEDLTRRFDAVLASREGVVDKLGSLLDLLLGHFTEHQAFVRIFFQSSEGGLVRTLPPEIRTFHLHYSDSIRDLFRKGVKEGAIVPLDPAFLALCYEGFVSAAIRYWALTDFKEPLTQLSRKARETFGAILRPQGT